MKMRTTIGRETLIRDIVIKYPRTLKVFIEHRIAPCYAHLTVEAAALASGRNPDSVVAALKKSVRIESQPYLVSSGEGRGGMS